MSTLRVLEYVESHISFELLHPYSALTSLLLACSFESSVYTLERFVRGL